MPSSQALGPFEPAAAEVADVGVALCMRCLHGSVSAHPSLAVDYNIRRVLGRLADAVRLSERLRVQLQRVAKHPDCAIDQHCRDDRVAVYLGC